MEKWGSEMTASAEDEKDANKKHLCSKIIFLELTSGFCEWSPFLLFTFIARTMKGYSELQSSKSTKSKKTINALIV